MNEEDIIHLISKTQDNIMGIDPNLKFSHNLLLQKKYRKNLSTGHIAHFLDYVIPMVSWLQYTYSDNPNPDMECEFIFFNKDYNFSYKIIHATEVELIDFFNIIQGLHDEFMSM